MLFDTHAHIIDEKFENPDIIVQNFIKENGYAVINMGCNLESSKQGMVLSEKHPSVYFGAGFHPSDIDTFNEDSFNEIKRLSKHEKCVAIGEIGLDYYWQPYDKNKQIEVFINQLEFANQVKLPISIHSREATGDMINLLKKYKNKLSGGATMHCFSGSIETAKTLLDLGLYISFGGTLTFKNANKLLEVAKYVPIDRILTETDCPYLAPTPLRGSRNEPKNVRYVVEFLAFVRGVNYNSMCEQLKENTVRLFNKIKL